MSPLGKKKGIMLQSSHKPALTSQPPCCKYWSRLSPLNFTPSIVRLSSPKNNCRHIWQSVLSPHTWLVCSLAFNDDLLSHCESQSQWLPSNLLALNLCRRATSGTQTTLVYSCGLDAGCQTLMALTALQASPMSHWCIFWYFSTACTFLAG